MKKLLLIGLAVGGLAFVAGERADAQTTILVPRTEGLSFGFPSGYSAYPTRYNYYPYGYYRHPYVHYYPYAGNPYAYYSAPPSYRYSGTGPITATIDIIITTTIELTSLSQLWK